MGNTHKGDNKESKSKSKTNNSSNNQTCTKSNVPGLSQSDLDFLIWQTGSSIDFISQILDKFNQSNPDGRLGKEEFIRLYSELRPEPPELLASISEFVFKAFDCDHNGYIDFKEFLVCYALTSRGDLRRKLEYAFTLYDADGNDFIDLEEMKPVLHGMLRLLGAENKYSDIDELAKECLKELDFNNDGKISRAEFISGLTKNYSLRSLMSPFN